MLNSQITPSQHSEREKAYDIVSGSSSFGFESKVFEFARTVELKLIAFIDHFQIASLLKIPFLDEDTVNDSYPRKVRDAIGLFSLSFKYSCILVVRECVCSDPSSVGPRDPDH